MAALVRKPKKILDKSKTAIKKDFLYWFAHIHCSTKYKMAKILFVSKANTMSKLLLISNLLLGEKQVRACAPDSDSFLADSLADSGNFFGETQWACLRHAHALARFKPLSSVLVPLFYHARTFFQNCRK